MKIKFSNFISQENMRQKKIRKFQIANNCCQRCSRRGMRNECKKAKREGRRPGANGSVPVQ
jgi:hypothetical protein